MTEGPDLRGSTVGGAPDVNALNGPSRPAVGERDRGTIRSELRVNALGLPGVFMQGIGTISPGFSQLAGLVSTIALAAIISPLAFVLGGIVLAVQALNTSQLAREFPSAGGWYTWIARTVHPRAGFFAGWIMLLWLAPVGALVLSYLGAAFLQPAIQAYYGVSIPWWIFAVLGTALVAYGSYRGIKLSAQLLITTASLEIAIMIALAITGLVSPGPGGFSVAPINPANLGKAPDLFLAIVFAVFVFSGWEAIGPIAEESKNPRRYVPYALVGSVLILMVYELIASWGNMVGMGLNNLHSIVSDTAWPVATMAQRVWGGAWVLLAFALLNSAIAVCMGGFNGGTRTFFGMARSGSLPAVLGRVSPKRRTPTNAIHLEVLVSIVAIVLAAIFGVANVFFTYAIAFTFGLIVMYILADIGVVIYYLTEARAKFNLWLHLILPAAAIVAVGLVGYESAVPLPPPPERWSPVVIGVYLVLGGLLLGYLHSKGDGWIARSQMAMEEAPEQVPVQ